MGSGSSAVTDLLAEFKDCKNDFRDQEYIFLSCPNGLFDLEDKLLYGNNAIRSDEAIRSFLKIMKDLYDKKFWWVARYDKTAGKQFYAYCEQFIEEITQYHYDGFWYMNEYPNAKMIRRLIMRKPFKILLGRFHTFSRITTYEGQMRIAFMKPQEFYAAANRFIYNVIHMITNNQGNVILDQLLLPFNLYRIDHYFQDDTFVVVVERDPRDVYILNTYSWRKKQLEVPFPTDVHMFCKYYRDMRESEIKKESSKVLRVKFEDLIYQYENTVEKIRNHMKFESSDHIHKKTRFNPEISIANTQLFHGKKYAEEISVIESELSEYLYPFPYKINNSQENSIEF